jgi:hypothetical protein
MIDAGSFSLVHDVKDTNTGKDLVIKIVSVQRFIKCLDFSWLRHIQGNQDHEINLRRVSKETHLAS